MSSEVALTATELIASIVIDGDIQGDAFSGLGSLQMVYRRRISSRGILLSLLQDDALRAQYQV